MYNFAIYSTESKQIKLLLSRYVFLAWFHVNLNVDRKFSFQRSYRRLKSEKFLKFLRLSKG